MRKIEKTDEPTSLTQFKIDYPLANYVDLENGFQNIRIDIRESCIKEQFFLCSYCCNRIDLTNCHNEHIIPQNSLSGEDLTLDYTTNIVASCQSTNHCGHTKKNNLIKLTPLMTQCENEIVFQLNGKMTHTNQRAQNTINVLKLRNKGLEHKRKQLIDIILFQYVDDLNHLIIEENNYLELIIEDLFKPNVNGKLEAFSPVLINVLRHFIS